MRGLTSHARHKHKLDKFLIAKSLKRGKKGFSNGKKALKFAAGIGSLVLALISLMKLR